MFSELGKKISNLIHLGDAPFSLGVYAANVARGEYDSVRGRISSSWKIEDGLFSLEVLIPPNTTATVHLPSTDAVSESGRPLE